MISLSKGQKVSLDKGTNLCLVGLGWDPNGDCSDYDYDLDASVFLLGANGKVASEDDIVYFGNQTHVSGAVKSLGDDRSGDSSDGGDDEQIYINLSRVPAHVQKIVIAITIYDAENREQNFGHISNAFVRVVKVKSENDENGEEVVRYDLDEEFEDETAVVACEITRNGSEWKFGAVGMGYECELEGICNLYGLYFD